MEQGVFCPQLLIFENSDAPTFFQLLQLKCPNFSHFQKFSPTPMPQLSHFQKFAPTFPIAKNFLQGQNAKFSKK